MLLDLIKTWQLRATAIAPPHGTLIVGARPGLPGPSFFPEGLGLKNPNAECEWPNLMAIGHNFGCEAYRDTIEAVGREDETNITWRNLAALLNRAGTSVARCFMTNWFVGLQPGTTQVGKFFVKRDDRYESECRALLLEQIGGLKPQVIMLLGLDVVRLAHQIMPTLQPWAHAKSWRAVDEIGAVAMAVDVANVGVTANVVALLHPSFANSNRRHRSGPEEDMLRHALVGSS